MVHDQGIHTFKKTNLTIGFAHEKRNWTKWSGQSVANVQTWLTAMVSQHTCSQVLLLLPGSTG